MCDKKPDLNARGTVESRYESKVETLLQEDEDAAIEYMLKAIPFIKEYSDTTDTPSTDTPSTDTPLTKALGFKVVGSTSKKDIFNRYMAEVECDYSYIEHQKIPVLRKTRLTSDDWVCSACGVTRVLEQATGSLLCPSCGMTVPYMEVSHTNLSFEDQLGRNYNNCAYKRVNHFSEWINSLQARESTVIPDAVLDAVRLEFKKHRATSTSDITPVQVKKHLKKLRLSKWYEHVHAICHALGTSPPVLSPGLETTLKNMFAEIQAPFNKHVKRVAPARKNFLSYSYVLYKFCELLGETELMKHFSLLKSQEKLHQMDVIWKCICEELQWEFVPSV